MSTWSDTRLVALREVDEKLHSRTFVLSTLFFLLLVGLSIALPALLFDDGPESYDVAVVDADARELVAAVPEDVELTAVPTGEGDVDDVLRAEDADVALLLDGDALQLVALQSVPDDLREALTTTAQLGGVATALREAGSPEAAPLLSFAFIMLFFFVVFQFGYAIAQGVVQEKESRVVELLVSAVPVRTLLSARCSATAPLRSGRSSCW